MYNVIRYICSVTTIRTFTTQTYAQMWQRYTVKLLVIFILVSSVSLCIL